MISKLKSNKLQKSDKGFTIIEVMIVLAIAGLILLIVFLAVPALQRSSRNTARKGDVARITSSSAEFVANNNGTLPAVGDGASTDGLSIVKAAGKLSQYDFSATPANFNIIDVPATPVGVTNIDTINVVRSAKCSTSGKAIAGSARQLAVQYAIENSSSTTSLCVDN